MDTLTEAHLTAAGFPDELRPYLLNDTLIFSHARSNGTLEFMVPNEAEPKSAFTLIWHPEDPATWDYEGDRFYVKEEMYRDVQHYDPVGNELVDLTGFGDEHIVGDLESWLDQLPARSPISEAPSPSPAEPDRKAAGYLPACPHCRQRSHVRELEFWAAVSQTDPNNTVTVVEYQCHAPGCDSEPFWL